MIVSHPPLPRTQPDESQGVRLTETMTVVRDFLDFTDVGSVSAAYTEAQRRFGPGLGVDMSRDEWLAEPYNVERDATGRLFVAWTYEARKVSTLQVGTFSGTFTGWKRLEPAVAVTEEGPAM